MSSTAEAEKWFGGLGLTEYILFTTERPHLSMLPMHGSPHRVLGRMLTGTFDRYGHLMPGNEAEGVERIDASLERANSAARLAALDE